MAVEKEFREVSPNFEVAFSLRTLADLKLLSQMLHVFFIPFSDEEEYWNCTVVAY